jgi:hypothetical protein
MKIEGLVVGMSCHGSFDLEALDRLARQSATKTADKK